MTDNITDRRESLITATRERMNAIVDVLAPLYGSRNTFTVRLDDGTKWEIKWDDDDLEWTRVTLPDSRTIYVVSQKSAPQAKDLVEALDSVGEFADKVQNTVEMIHDQLAAVEVPSLPEEFEANAEATTDAYATHHKALVDELNRLTDALVDLEGGRGSFTVSHEDELWEIKWDDDGDVEWFRVGGRGGTYLHGQYGKPSVSTYLNRLDDVTAVLNGAADAINGYETRLRAWSPPGEVVNNEAKNPLNEIAADVGGDGE